MHCLAAEDRIHAHFTLRENQNQLCIIILLLLLFLRVTSHNNNLRDNDHHAIIMRGVYEMSRREL